MPDVYDVYNSLSFHKGKTSYDVLKEVNEGVVFWKKLWLGGVYTHLKFLQSHGYVRTEEVPSTVQGIDSKLLYFKDGGKRLNRPQKTSLGLEGRLGLA